MNTHRRAGKTIALVNDVLYGALQCPLRKPQLAYIGPTFTQAKRIAWAYLKDYAEPYLAKPPQESELKLTLKNEATVFVLGADNADSLRGMYLDGTVNDEYALWRPSVFSQIIRPALSDRNGWSVFASTPRGKNLFHDTHKGATSNPQDWYSLTLKASESGIISPKELDALRKEMDPEEFAQEYECSFDAALKGAIYAKEVDELFADKRVILTDEESLYDADLPIHAVFDLGFTDATVTIWWQFQKGRLVIVRCEATTGVDIFHHIANLHNFAGEVGDVWLPHDARAKNLQTGKSMVEQFLSEGIKPRLVPRHNVRDGIAAARKVFPSIVIEETGTGELIEALKAYRRKWNEELMMFSDQPVHDWASDYADAFRYLCVICGISEDAQLQTAAARAAKDRSSSSYNLETLFMDHESQQRQSMGRIS